MKKIYILLIALFLLNFAKAQWTSLTSPTQNQLNAVFFVNKDTGYIGGFRSQPGNIFKTMDGGKNWTQVADNSGIYSLYFLSSDTGIATSGLGAIIKTTDGGISWKSSVINSYNYNSVFMTSSTNGCAVGGDGAGNGTILRTTNGGNSWDASVNGLSGGLSDLYSVFFPNPMVGYAVGTTTVKTIDGGATWNYFYTGLGNGTTLSSVFFINSDTGYIAGCGTIAKTVDGGINWAKQTSNLSNCVNAIYFIDVNNGFAVGNSGSILNTTNAGKTWTIQTSGTSSNLRSVIFTKNNIGYAVGDGGTLLKYTVNATNISELFNDDKIFIYPNPINDKFNIEIDNQKGLYNLEILNIIGQVILNKKLINSVEQIDLTGQAAGVYFVKLQSANNTVVKKIIKN